MNDLSPASDNIGRPAGTRNGRLSAKLRTALHLIATEGMKQADAAQRAGIHQSNLSKALNRPHVIAELDAMKQRVAETIQSMKGHYRILALDHAWYLAKNAKSEAVQARMVELLAGETKAPSPITVQTNVFTPGANGYEYLPPGAQIVDITPVEQGSEGSGEGAPIHAEDEGEE